MFHCYWGGKAVITKTLYICVWQAWFGKELWKRSFPFSARSFKLAIWCFIDILSQKLFAWFMWFYPSHGYQGTEDTWCRIFELELLLKKYIMLGHTHWDNCPRVFAHLIISFLQHLLPIYSSENKFQFLYIDLNVS